MQIVVNAGSAFSGESDITGHEDQLDAIAVYDAVRGAVGTAGRARHSDIVVVRNVDDGSPKLAAACSAGTQLGTVEVKIFKNTADGAAVLGKICLNEAYVSRYTRGTLDTRGVLLGAQVGYGNRDVPHYRDLMAKVTSSSGDAAATDRAAAGPNPLFDLQLTGFTNREIEHIWFCGNGITWQHGTNTKSWNIATSRSHDGVYGSA
jgi:hypothetical protein